MCPRLHASELKVPCVLKPTQDILPYVPLLMPELQKALVDPLPEVRAMSARALGSLMQVRLFVHGHGMTCVLSSVSDAEE